MLRLTLAALLLPAAATAAEPAGSPLDLQLSLQPGFGVRQARCTDDGDAQLPPTLRPDTVPSQLNTPCSAPTAQRPGLSGGALQLLGLDLTASLRLAPALGLSARLRFDLWPAFEALQESSPSPALLVELGPQLRLADDALRLHPTFALGVARVTPITGNLTAWPDVPLTDGGSFTTQHVSGGLDARLLLSLGPRADLAVGLWGAVVAQPVAFDHEGVRSRVSGAVAVEYEDAAGRAETRQELPAAAPDVRAGLRADVGLDVGPLFPLGDGAVSLGPVVGAAWHLHSISFPDELQHIWGYDGPQPVRWGPATDGPLVDQRRFYSTEVQTFVGRVGLRLSWASPRERGEAVDYLEDAAGFDEPAGLLEGQDEFEEDFEGDELEDELEDDELKDELEDDELKDELDEDELEDELEDDEFEDEREEDELEEDDELEGYEDDGRFDDLEDSP